MQLGLPGVRYLTGLSGIWLFVWYINDSNIGQCMCKWLKILCHRHWHCQCSVFWRDKSSVPENSAAEVSFATIPWWKIIQLPLTLSLFSLVALSSIALLLTL